MSSFWCWPGIFKSERGVRTQRDGIENGYKSYAKKLDGTTEGIPVRFREEIEKFDVERLEWLTILLIVGALAQRGPRKNVREHISENNSSTDCSSCSGDERTLEKLQDVDHLDPAINTLRMQLDFTSRGEALFTNAKVGVHNVSPYPMSNINFKDVSE